MSKPYKKFPPPPPNNTACLWVAAFWIAVILIIGWIWF